MIRPQLKGSGPDALEAPKLKVGVEYVILVTLLSFMIGRWSIRTTHSPAVSTVVSEQSPPASTHVPKPPPNYSMSARTQEAPPEDVSRSPRIGEAIRREASSRESATTMFSNIILPFHTNLLAMLNIDSGIADILNSNAILSIQLAMLSEAYTYDLLEHRQKFDQLMTNSLIPEQYQEFVLQQKQHMGWSESDRMVAALKENGFTVDDTTVSALREAVLSTQAFPEATIGLYDSPPSPAVDLETKLRIYTNRINRVRSYLPALMQALTPVLSAQEIEVIRRFQDAKATEYEKTIDWILNPKLFERERE